MKVMHSSAQSTRRVSYLMSLRSQLFTTFADRSAAMQHRRQHLDRGSSEKTSKCHTTSTCGAQHANRAVSAAKASGAVAQSQGCNELQYTRRTFTRHMELTKSVRACCVIGKAAAACRSSSR